MIPVAVGNLVLVILYGSFIKEQMDGYSLIVIYKSGRAFTLVNRHRYCYDTSGGKTTNLMFSWPSSAQLRQEAF